MAATGDSGSRQSALASKCRVDAAAVLPKKASRFAHRELSAACVAYNVDLSVMLAYMGNMDLSVMSQTTCTADLRRRRTIGCSHNSRSTRGS